jgi:carboxylesterase
MGGAAEPFALGGGDDACLLLHGLTGAPSEMRPVGEALAAAGFRAVGPLLPGHGTTPRDLVAISRSDVLDAASDALASLRGARRVFVGGLSVGALLAVRLAARGGGSGPAPAALALLAPAIRMAGMNWAFTNVIGRLPPFGWLLGKGHRDVQGPQPRPAGNPRRGHGGARQWADGSYTQIPWRWGRELRVLAEEALADAHRVRVRTLILHGALDGTAAPSGARLLARALGGPVQVRMLPRSGHVLPIDVEGPEVCAAIVRFFQEEG